MWEYIKTKLNQLGCFVLIALTMIAVTAITKVVLGWLDIDEASKESISKSAGEFVGKGILGIAVLIGFIILGRQLILELRGKKRPASEVCPLPPPLPVESTISPVSKASYGKKSSIILKGCFGIVIVFTILIISAVSYYYYLDYEYEKRPKSPGEVESSNAERFIISYKGKEVSGNTQESIVFGEKFVNNLKISRLVLYPESRNKSNDSTKTYYLTYCHITDDAALILVHVPDLRKYKDESKLLLSEFAWEIATRRLKEDFPHVKKLVIGIKGMMDYASIYEGVITSDIDELKGIIHRHDINKNEVFWKYFTSDKNNEIDTHDSINSPKPHGP